MIFNRADQGRRLAGGTQNRVDQLRAGGLAVGACDGGQRNRSSGLSKKFREARRECLTPVRHLQPRATKSAGTGRSLTTANAPFSKCGVRKLRAVRFCARETRKTDILAPLFGCRKRDRAHPRRAALAAHSKRAELLRARGSAPRHAPRHAPVRPVLQRANLTAMCSTGNQQSAGGRILSSCQTFTKHVDIQSDRRSLCITSFTVLPTKFGTLGAFGSTSTASGLGIRIGVARAAFISSSGIGGSSSASATSSRLLRLGWMAFSLSSAQLPRFLPARRAECSTSPQCRRHHSLEYRARRRAAESRIARSAGDRDHNHDRGFTVGAKPRKEALYLCV